MKAPSTTHICQQLLLLTLLLLGPTASRADHTPLCHVRSLSVADGLPGSTITGLTQATDGLMWLTTWNGLSCYDGYRFTTFHNLPGTANPLATNHLTMVQPAASGSLWATAYSGDVLYFSTTSCRFTNVSAHIRQYYGHAFDLRKTYPLSTGHTWLVGKGTEHYRLCDSLVGTERPVRHTLPGTVTKVVADSHGREWVLTDRGTWLVQPGQSAPRRLSPTPFTHLCELADGTWLATDDGRLARLRWNSQKLETAGNTGKTSVADMVAMDDSHIALRTAQGVMVYDSREHTMHTIFAQPAEAIMADGKGRLWCFTPQYIFLYTPTGFSPVPIEPASPGQTATADRPILHTDAQGGVWMASPTVPFSHYDERRNTLVPQQIGGLDGVPRIKSGFSDSQGNLWLVCPHSLAVATFHYPRTTTVSLGTGRDTRSVFIDHEGSLLLGTIDGEVARCRHDGTVEAYLSADGHWQTARTALADRVYALYEDRRHRLWIGTKGRGLYCLEREGSLSHYMPDAHNHYAISSDAVYDLREDTQGRLLVATYGGGLNIVDERGGTVRFIHAGNSLRGYDATLYNKVRRIEPLANGTVLLSTTQGLLTYGDRYRRAEDIRFHATRQHNGEGSLLSNDVLQTCQTRDGTVYVVTLGGGLQCIIAQELLQDNLELEDVTDSRGHTLSLQHGYGTLQALAATSDGSLWVMGESRVARLRGGTVREYSLGTVASSLTEARPYCDGGQLLLATEGGAVTFRSDDMTATAPPPAIVFTTLRHMDSEQPLPLLHTPLVEVDNDHRSFTIHFAALDYGGPAAANDGIRYAYCLDGDSVWNELQAGSNSVSFNHFPPGFHTLTVRSTNRDGLWTDNRCTLTIHAQPTFLESWWGRSLLALVGLALLTLAVRAYMRRRTAQITEEATEHAEAGKVRYVLRQPEIVDEDKVFMDKLLAHIEEHLADADLKVDDMAAALCVSRSTLYAQVRQLADMSPSNFLRHVRLTRAEELVAGSSLTFSQIAYATGFSDPKYFGKCFKKRTGLSPSDYRAQQSPTGHGEEEPAS